MVAPAFHATIYSFHTGKIKPAPRRELSELRALCLRRFRGVAPKNPTTFEKVDETFMFLHFSKYSI